MRGTYNNWIISYFGFDSDTGFDFGVDLQQLLSVVLQKCLQIPQNKVRGYLTVASCSENY
ncbi:unnamed protein product, partial [Callosobruchus maculatus]